jgi:isopenicillin N synthase-like dioxygenase
MATRNTPPSTTKLELRTAYGSVFRDVLNIPPRDCTPEEIQVIDLTRLYSKDIKDRRALAKEIRAASVNTGFFYIKNHGIEEEKITNARKQLLAYVDRSLPCRKVTKIINSFFKQPGELKMKIHQSNSKYFNGWKVVRQTNISPGGSIDAIESVS